MKKFFVIFLLGLSSYHIVGAFNAEEKEKIQTLLSMKKNYQEQLIFLESLKAKGEEGEYIVSLKEEIYKKNFKQILKDYSRDYQNNKSLYEKYFAVLKSMDPDASLSPYYFVKLKDEIYKSDIYLKSFVYLYFKLKEKSKNDGEYFTNFFQNLSNELEKPPTKIPLLEPDVFQYLKKNKYHYLSKKDAEKLKTYILKNKIGTDSKTFRYYTQYKGFLSNFPTNSVYLKNTFTQKLQEKNLSCEVNSASLWASYLLRKEIHEEDIFFHIPKFDIPLENKGEYYIWGNPHEEFVGNIEGKQTKIIENMTGYGVYAKPISRALYTIGIKNKVTKIDTDIIIKSLLENEPIMFWYLSKNSAGILNTSPVIWKTLNNKTIQGYIGEHTGVIVGISFFNNGAIDKIFFYEGRNMELQSLSYHDFQYQTSFFDMMITKE